MPHGFCDRHPESEKLRTNYAEDKKGLISWIVSHCNTHNGRENYVDELQKYIDVQIYGKCEERLYSTSGLCNDRNGPSESLCPDMCNTINSYKFYLSFENSNCVDYLTETTYKVLIPGIATVPVIMTGFTTAPEMPAAPDRMNSKKKKFFFFLVPFCGVLPFAF